MVSGVTDPLEAILCRCFSPKGERNVEIVAGVFTGHKGWLIADVTGNDPHVCIRLQFLGRPTNLRAEPGDWKSLTE